MSIEVITYDVGEHLFQIIDGCVTIFPNNVTDQPGIDLDYNDLKQLVAMHDAAMKVKEGKP